jgi:hypothetical protein
MYPETLFTKISNASFLLGSSEDAMSPKLVVPVKDFHPDSLLSISSAREICRDAVEDGESFPTFVA